MRKFSIVIVLLVLLSCQFVKPVSARSGCCSHHGGVCGCGCCDGSSLSSTCAPYYPECSGGGDYVAPITAPTIAKATPLPTLSPTLIPTREPTASPTPISTPTLTSTPTQTISIYPTNQTEKTDNMSGGGALGATVLLSGISYGGYRWLKSKSKATKEV